MSTLVAQTISNGTVSTSSENVIQGSAKAWVNFSGVQTPVIRASYNVSSITYTATALFTVNFTNAFADNNYSVVGMAQRDSNNICVVSILGSASYNSLSTTAAQLTTLENTNQRVTAQTVCAAFFR
jgi:hypothetical protein